MSEEKKVNQPDGLQFDKAVYRDSAAGQTVCTMCKSPLPGRYYQVNQKVACPVCKDKLEKQFAAGSAAGRVGKALVFGLPAAILGAGIYYAIMALTGYEFGLVAILIGWMVGAAVRKGSNYRGGLPYQLMAVILTYMSICSTYIPSILRGMRESSVQTSAGPSARIFPDASENDILTKVSDSLLLVSSAQADAIAPDSAIRSSPESPAAEENFSVFQYIIGFAVIFIFALAAPFFGGAQNIIGLLIIGFGLFEAWKMNKKTALDIQGPFDVTPQT